MRFSGVLALIALFGVTACDEAPLTLDALPLLGGQPDETGRGVRTLGLLNGAVRARAPEGYCIDQSSSRARDGFALMAGCAVVTDEIGVSPSLDALLLVQFGDAESALVAGNEAALAALLEDSAGAVLLGAEDGGVDVREVQQSENRVIVRYVDDNTAPLQGTSGPIWRGFVDVSGHLATVSVLSYTRDPLTAREGRVLLNVALDALEEANGASES